MPSHGASTAELVPLSAELGRLHVTVSTQFAWMLAEARDARPEASVQALLESARRELGVAFMGHFTRGKRSDTRHRSSSE